MLQLVAAERETLYFLQTRAYFHTPFLTFDVAVAFI